MSTAIAPRRRATPKASPVDLVPTDLEAEQAMIGTMLVAGRESQAMVDAMLSGSRVAMFFHHIPRECWMAIRDMRAAGHPVDTVTFFSWCKEKATLAPADAVTVMGWPDTVPSIWNWTYYRDLLIDKARRRNILAIASRAQEMARDATIDPDSLRREFAETLADVSAAQQASRPRLVIRRASERIAYRPPPGLDLIGTAEIRKGHEGITILAGPGSSGKSLLVGTLALAGALGTGTWMGRKVHRKFKTLVIQGEVGPMRIGNQMAEYQRMHPDADIEDCVIYSDPPEGGFAIADAEFWASLKRTVEEVKPDLVVIDPISHLSVEDQAAEVMNAIRVIRLAVGVGEDAPGILFVAHTKKPRSEESMRGRNLAHAVSGSVAWVNTSRCTYLCVPWDPDDIEDDRIYFSAPKINDGPNYAPTVWRRRFGTFFAHDPETDPSTWGREKTKDEAASERQRITFADLQKAFGTRPGMKRSELVKALMALDLDEATCYRATRAGGYLERYLVETAGVLGLRTPA